SIDNGFQIFGETLNLIGKIPLEQKLDPSCREELVSEIIKLTDLDNIPEITNKVSKSYSENLLLASLKFINEFNSNIEDWGINKLNSFMGIFLFDQYVDSIKHLATFVEKEKNNLNEEIIIILFENCITYLSKMNFKQLETVFETLTAVTPNVSSELLYKLSLSKKSLSQQFLETLLTKGLTNAKDSNIYDKEFWSLITHILELDIEVGIKHCELLMDLIFDQHQGHYQQTNIIWKKLITCYINAREFTKFLELWENYCIKNVAKTNLFLKDAHMADFISRNLVSLSVSQWIQLLSSMKSKITDSAASDLEILVLEVILQGLKQLSFSVLPQLKDTLNSIYNIEDTKFSMWRSRYLLMEVYDNVISQEQLDNISTQSFQKATKNDEVSRDLFYYYFKLREYKEFDLEPVIKLFISYIGDKEQDSIRGSILKDIFVNWSSLINSEFDKESLKTLIDYLIEDSNIDILEVLFNNDDFFEESNIIFQLVSKLSEKFENDIAVLYLSNIPIQCFNKNTRIELINKISSKTHATSNDKNIILHLLQYPTFKSSIEHDISKLYNFSFVNSEEYPVKNDVFEKVWSNHLSQIKDESSSTFIKNSINFILQGVNENDRFFTMTFLILINSPEQLVDELKTVFFKRAALIISDTADLKLKSSLMRYIYSILKVGHFEIEETVSKSLLKNIQSLQNADMDNIDLPLLSNSFLLYCTLYSDKIEWLFAHYLVMRSYGIESDTILPGVKYVLLKRTKSKNDEFNSCFTNVISSLASTKSEYTEGVLELYNTLIAAIDVGNSEASILFAKSISVFFTQIEEYLDFRNVILQVLNSIQELLIAKSWLFSQYTIELLFPICIRLNQAFTKVKANNDDIYISTNKVISNILLVHRIKLSNRNHLLNNLFCSQLEFLSRDISNGLSFDSAKSLSRTITNYCEPSNIVTKSSTKNSLGSNISLIKKSLRKDIPILLVKFIHLSITKPFEVNIRKELISCIYSIFDILSSNELNLVNAILDNSGRQYFKTLYADYNKLGKWRED
ncbi:hypothetical protein Kpol_1073p31, partial [Vanderwaltozyma polyspora DSM 70294]